MMITDFSPPSLVDDYINKIFKTNSQIQRTHDVIQGYVKYKATTWYDPDDDNRPMDTFTQITQINVYNKYFSLDSLYPLIYLWRDRVRYGQ